MQVNVVIDDHFCTDIKVEVRRIDYGDDICVSLRDIKEMSGEIASRPVQALQVSLANVGDGINIIVVLVLYFSVVVFFY